jgi:hypothetical protein
MKESLYAEDVGHYWKTGNSSPDTWLDRTKKEIAAVGGVVLRSAYADEHGVAAYLIEFRFIPAPEVFRIVWPVLESRTGNERAARIQATTFLYHDVKNRCMGAKVLGARASFFSYVVTPDGRTAAQLTTPELSERWPKMLTGG